MGHDLQDLEQIQHLVYAFYKAIKYRYDMEQKKLVKLGPEWSRLGLGVGQHSKYY